MGEGIFIWGGREGGREGGERQRISKGTCLCYHLEKVTSSFSLKLKVSVATHGMHVSHTVCFSVG